MLAASAVLLMSISIFLMRRCKSIATRSIQKTALHPYTHSHAHAHKECETKQPHQPQAAIQANLITHLANAQPHPRELHCHSRTPVWSTSAAEPLPQSGPPIVADIYRIVVVVPADSVMSLSVAGTAEISTAAVTLGKAVRLKSNVAWRCTATVAIYEHSRHAEREVHLMRLMLPTGKCVPLIDNVVSRLP